MSNTRSNSPIYFVIGIVILTFMIIFHVGGEGVPDLKPEWYAYSIPALFVGMGIWKAIRS